MYCCLTSDIYRCKMSSHKLTSHRWKMFAWHWPVIHHWSDNSHVFTLSQCYNEPCILYFIASYVAVVIIVAQSSLLQCLLGELKALRGSVEINGRVSYASQTPWVFSGTLQENILFGSPLNLERYNKVIDACALRKVSLRTWLCLPGPLWVQGSPQEKMIRELGHIMLLHQRKLASL